MFSLWLVTRAAFDATSEGVHRLLVQLLGDGDEGADGESAGVDRGVFYSQLGMAVRPVISRTLRALGLERGDEVAVLKMWDTEVTATDLAVGETRIHACGDLDVRISLKTDGLVISAKGATITFTPDGTLQVLAAAGQDLTLNGGTLAVARVSDPVTPDLGLVTTLSAIVGILNAAPGPVLSAPGAVPPFASPSVGTITSGNATVKA